MKRTLLIAATALALSAPAVPHAHAGQRHVWNYINYAQGTCERSMMSPQQSYNVIDSPAGHMSGLTLDRIAPDHVTKSANGDIQVDLSGKKDGNVVEMHFFTSMAACKAYIADHGVTAEEAPADDIK